MFKCNYTISCSQEKPKTENVNEMTNLFARRTSARCHIQKDFCIAKCGKPFLQANQMIVQTTFLIITGNNRNLACKTIRITNATPFAHPTTVSKRILLRKCYQIYSDKKKKTLNHEYRCQLRIEHQVFSRSSTVERTENTQEILINVII